MAETINDRIETIINEHFARNKAAFAKVIGLPPTSMSSYLGRQRRSKPSVDMIAKIVVQVGVDAHWLLVGEHTPKMEVHTEGDYSPASLNGNPSVIASNDTSILTERVKHLEELLAEKERLISVLMEGRK